MIFRLSQKLNTKIKAGVFRTLTVNDNPLADWSAHLFVADQTQFVLLSNTESLFSTVMFGKRITSENKFVENALGCIREFMEDDGYESVYRRQIYPESGTIRFSNALNRSVTVSMTDMIHHATTWLIEGKDSLHEIAAKLNQIPFSWLKFGTPLETFKNMVRAQ